jgi:hypothetical protein
VHLRNQFHHFEWRNAIDDPAYKKEVSDWLAGPEREIVFSKVHEQIVSHLSLEFAGQLNKSSFSVFVAGDNEEVKAELIQYLEQTKERSLRVISMNSKGIEHIGNHDRTHGEEVMKAIALDW